MKLAEIIAADAKFLHNVEVTIDRRYPTVLIEDLDGDWPSIFMQGDAAEQFSDAVDALCEASPESTFHDLELSVAKPYVESIWN